ncbi:hypothetical protein [Mycoplasmopsis fermentans]|uniref:hypothetical protein n=1 Tax=Mycoplasmopsis fermentans TaxID=2115 RepID=UPI000F019C9E|nr:hypothetical protein [Mycoplasmopsis fermentans]RMX35262.1 hypothetical protein MFI2_0435 [Mycoplasmopsis fermentans MF-I2]RMX35398.1 hypothetical protein MFI1_0448 [Mycoplasmopsis fermentans MF-I1]
MKKKILNLSILALSANTLMTITLAASCSNNKEVKKTPQVITDVATEAQVKSVQEQLTKAQKQLQLLIDELEAFAYFRNSFVLDALKNSQKSEIKAFYQVLINFKQQENNITQTVNNIQSIQQTLSTTTYKQEAIDELLTSYSKILATYTFTNFNFSFQQIWTITLNYFQQTYKNLNNTSLKLLKELETIINRQNTALIKQYAQNYQFLQQLQKLEKSFKLDSYQTLNNILTYILTQTKPLSADTIKITKHLDSILTNIQANYYNYHKLSAYLSANEQQTIKNYYQTKLEQLLKSIN